MDAKNPLVQTGICSSQQEFQQKIKDLMYKTTSQNYGSQTSHIPQQNIYGISGKFTDHLLSSGMYKNASLNTTADRDRWLEGSKDWMQKLG